MNSIYRLFKLVIYAAIALLAVFLALNYGPSLSNLTELNKVLIFTGLGLLALLVFWLPKGGFNDWLEFLMRPVSFMVWIWRGIGGGCLLSVCF
jgi:hypothetical protein